MSTATETAIDTEILVIGFGNTLRQDDSVGPRVAERLAALNLHGVRTLVCEQLSPEHAAPIARARMTVFVDAVRGAPRHVRLQPVAPGASGRLTTHAAVPATVLALAREVYGRTPRAWLAPVPVARLGFGSDLSITARRGVDDALRTIVRFAQIMV